MSGRRGYSINDGRHPLWSFLRVLLIAIAALWLERTTKKWDTEFVTLGVIVAAALPDVFRLIRPLLLGALGATARREE